MALTLQNLITPLSQQNVLAALLAALQGVGQVTQSGAGGAAPQGLGTLALSGVPATAYSAIVIVTSGTPANPSGSTSGLSIKISLDGGASWSGVQSSGGQSPWALALTDYRTSTPTGLTLTFTDGSISTSSWVLNETYVFPTFVPNYSLTDFTSGSVQLTLVEADALVTSSWTGLIASITAGGFTTTASLPWLILLASNLYNLQWRGPTSTIGQVIVKDSAGAGPFTIQQGQLWFAALSGNLYQIATPNTVTLPQNGSILLEVIAQNPGAAYNDPANSIASSISPGALITSLPGVTVSNPLGTNLGSGPWLAATAHSVGDLIRPGNGFLYVVEPGGIAGSGTTGSTQPAFPTVIGATVVDNPGGNQVTWTCYGADGAASSYIQSGASIAAGAVFGYVPSIISAPPSAATNVVLRLTSSTNANSGVGYLGQISVAVSTDGGLTFGAPALLQPQNSALSVNLVAWQATHGYAQNALVKPVTLNGSYFINTTAGTNNSGGAEPAWPTTTGATVVDGSVTWKNAGPCFKGLVIGAGGSGGPNLGGSVTIVLEDSQITPGFNVGDAYIFNTDWALDYGNTAETAVQLATRCQNQWGTLSTATPLQQIEAWALAASVEVQVATASPDPNGTGAVALYIAGASGAVSNAAVVLVSNYVNARLPIGSTILNGVAVSAQNATVTLTGKVYCPSASIGAAQAALSQQLIALAQLAGIGNSNGTTGTLRFSQVNSAIQAAVGATGYVDGLVMSIASGGTVNASDDVLLSDGYIGLFAAVTSLTWIGI